MFFLPPFLFFHSFFFFFYLQETPGTFRQPDTDEVDEMTAAISSISTSFPSNSERNTYEETETNTEHGLNFTQAPGVSEILNDSPN